MGARRHKIAQKYRDELSGMEDVLYGDSSSDATLYSSLIADLTKTAGGIAAAEQKKKAEAEKNKDRDMAVKAAATARKNAFMAQADAEAARAKSNAQPNNQALKTAAEAAEQQAKSLDAEAKAIEAKAAYYNQMSFMNMGAGGMNPYDPMNPMNRGGYRPQSGGMPWWGWALIGVGGLGLVGALVLRRK